MAQIELSTGNAKPKLVSPPGYEVVDHGVATEVILSGQLVALGASGWSKLAANQLDFDGVALHDCAAGEGGCSFLIQGEMDGYLAMTPGTDLFPSASVAGGIQTDVVASAPVRMKAVTATRIRFNCV